MTARPDADVAVVGAGIIGLCTAFALRERGASVRVYERGVPGNGQSGGDSRIFRHAHDDPRLVSLTRESRDVWRAWQEQLGVELVSSDGVVALGDRAIDRLAIADTVPGTPLRRAEPDEIGDWLPILAAHDGPATVDEGGGATRNRAAVESLAAALGDALVADEVLGLRTTDSGTVEVRSGGHTSQHERAVICAGLGTAPLLRGVGLQLPVTLGAHVRLTFPLREGPVPRLACLQDGSGAFGETGVYATPSPGNGAYGVGLSETIAAHEGGGLVDPGGLAEHVARLRTYVQRALPGLVPEPVDVRHCWVTELPWSPDGVAVWEAGPVLAIAGHNLFKNAPGLGRALARAATGDGLRDELRPEAQLGAAAAPAES
ncbi:MAG TPA: FAD-binding oxidoreductase [Baekduia sp.]|nr:FAD-binding oxidoreductase [Baekduia sp.]